MSYLGIEMEQAGQGFGLLEREDVDSETSQVYEGIRNGTLEATDLQKLFDTDKLTGFLNLKGFERRLERYLVKGVKGVLIAVDVDEFKRFNDTEGHPLGDRLLQTSAQVLLHQTRLNPLDIRHPEHRHLERTQEHDLVGRVGGDEFLVFLAGAEMPDAIKAAKRVRSAIADTAKQRFPSYKPEQTMSLGLTAVRPSDNAGLLRQRADAALYEAKKGRGSGIIEESIAVY